MTVLPSNPMPFEPEKETGVFTAEAQRAIPAYNKDEVGNVSAGTIKKAQKVLKQPTASPEQTQRMKELAERFLKKYEEKKQTGAVCDVYIIPSGRFLSNTVVIDWRQQGKKGTIHIGSIKDQDPKFLSGGHPPDLDAILEEAYRLLEATTQHDPIEAPEAPPVAKLAKYTGVRDGIPEEGDFFGY